MPKTLDLQESLVLDAMLSFSTRVALPMDLDCLHKKITASGKGHITFEDLCNVLGKLTFQDLVESAPNSEFLITERGRARLIADEAREIFGERAPTEPIRASYCGPLIGEERIPDTVLLCIDENELDGWWRSLSAEQKGDCFAGFALSMHEGSDSHVYVESADRIPVDGTIGEPTTSSLKDQLRRSVDREGARA
jgi:hypothetical protein